MGKNIKNSKITTCLCLCYILVVSCLSRMATYYAQRIAYGYDYNFTYFLIKGVVISIICLLVYSLVKQYGNCILGKHHLIFGMTGSIIIFGMYMLKSTLLRLDIAVLSAVIGYAYAALPILQVITICSLTESLQNVCKSKLSVKTVLFILATVLFSVASGNVFRTILLVAFLTEYIKELKNKCIVSKAVKAAIGIVAVCLLAVELYELWIAVCKYIKMFNESGYMTVIARNAWSLAKPFGSISDLSVVGGNVNDFSLLWLACYIGFVPTLLAIVLTVFALVFVLKNREVDAKSLALSYIIVCAVFSLLTNIGVILPGFFANMPAIPDSVAGMINIFLLLGWTNRRSLCN